MKTKIAVIATVLILLPLAQSASAEVPAWIKTNAGWWADGQIEDSDFVQGIQFLIKEGILVVPTASVSGEKSDVVPDWVKTSAAWWSEGLVSDDEFVNGLQHLMKIGIISVQTDSMTEETVKSASTKSSDNSKVAALQAELEACQEIKKAYKRLDCEKEVKAQLTLIEYKENSTPYNVGPVTFYNPGVEFEISSSGQALLTVKMLAENTGSSDNVALSCTGPAICSYDVTDGSKAYKYSGMDFTNGQIVLKPGEAKEFTMLFGPNIGYGGTTFEYDSSKSYSFRINEPWGSMSIPIDLG
ncbi:peptidase [Nitrosopumilus sp. b1]|uniref:peptidase n=1 Tax=Nitrosopumilus sp. b1 TaxID=2109907 RepID=UPI0015F61A83|nr:peptidase [Nitrosopumilus sp. b1]KAF6243445.1 peptidase [Nitrosopumilus sp. b1]